LDCLRLVWGHGDGDGVVKVNVKCVKSARGEGDRKVGLALGLTLGRGR
jgi:hypothetical protein